jgi:AsmA protein
MRKLKVAAVSLGAVVALAVLWLTAFGVPAGLLVRSISSQIESRSDLVPRFSGPVKLALWPSFGVVVEKVGLRGKNATEEIFYARRARVGVPLGSLLSGHPRIKEIAITDPVVRLAGAAGRGRQKPRSQSAKASPLPESHWLRALSIERLSADNLTLIAHDERETKERHVDALRLTSFSSDPARVDVELDVKSGTETAKLNVKAKEPAQFLEGRPMPIEAKLESSALSEPAQLDANLQLSGPVLRIDDLQGTLAGGPVRGAASVSFAASKPYIEAQMEATRLDLTDLLDEQNDRDGKATVDSSSSPAPLYSDKPVSLLPLHMLDADVRLSAGEVRLKKMHISRAVVEAALLDAALTVTLSRAELYGGRADGTFVVDSSGSTPQLALRFGLANVQALPLLTDAIDFRHVEGLAQAGVDVKAVGASPQLAVSSLQGTAKVNFTEGALRGIDLNDMVQSLLHRILSGWQESGNGKTQFSTFSASFDIQNGRARTKDLQFAGPHIRLAATGTADLTRQTLNFRTDPKLTTERNDSDGGKNWSIGVPVTIKGTWSQPKIYPELQGIFDNPEGILREFRKRRSGSDEAERSDGPERPLGKLLQGLIKPRQSDSVEAPDDSRPAAKKRRDNDDRAGARDSDEDSRDRPLGRLLDRMRRRNTEDDDKATDTRERPLGKFLDDILGDKDRSRRRNRDSDSDEE